MMAVVNEVVFRRMDQRIATYLVGQSKASNPISTTHQQIAAEIGTSREVVSRLLESFQEEGFIQVSRGSIEIVDHSGLAAISEL
jgi:CRP/FNR family transcriptional regulator